MQAEISREKLKRILSSDALLWELCERLAEELGDYAESACVNLALKRVNLNLTEVLFELFKKVDIDAFRKRRFNIVEFGRIRLLEFALQEDFEEPKRCVDELKRIVSIIKNIHFSFWRRNKRIKLAIGDDIEDFEMFIAEVVLDKIISLKKEKKRVTISYLRAAVKYMLNDIGRKKVLNTISESELFWGTSFEGEEGEDEKENKLETLAVLEANSEVDLEAVKITLKSIQKNLSEREKKLLCILLKRSGEKIKDCYVIGRSGKVLSGNSLDKALSRLRGKLRSLLKEIYDLSLGDEEDFSQALDYYARLICPKICQKHP